MDYIQFVSVSASQISLIGNNAQMKQTTEIRKKNQIQWMRNLVRKSNDAVLSYDVIMTQRSDERR